MEARFIAQEFGGQAVDRQCALFRIALRIDVAVEVIPGQLALKKLNAANFNDSVTLFRVNAGSFGIEDDLTHKFTNVFVASGEV